MWCARCGHKYEYREPLRKKATYKKCKDCKWFEYDTKDKYHGHVYGRCFCPTKKPRKVSDRRGHSWITEVSGRRLHTTKACLQFEQRIEERNGNSKRNRTGSVTEW